MQITNITSTYDGDKGITMVYGLGDDNNVYYWDTFGKKWALFQ